MHSAAGPNSAPANSSAAFLTPGGGGGREVEPEVAAEPRHRLRAGRERIRHSGEGAAATLHRTKQAQSGRTYPTPGQQQHRRGRCQCGVWERRNLVFEVDAAGEPAGAVDGEEAAEIQDLRKEEAKILSQMPTCYCFMRHNFSSTINVARKKQHAKSCPSKRTTYSVQHRSTCHSATWVKQTRIHHKVTLEAAVSEIN
jgi:hypothetical protein